MLKRHCSSVELLPHDVVELILERLPVKFLLRFKSVSKEWKSTIQSQRFQERQFIRRKQSRGPDVLLVPHDFSGDNVPAQRIVLGSSIASTLGHPDTDIMICHGSCDGLICIYCLYTPSVVVNPATRWHQSFPLSNFQQLLNDRYDKQEHEPFPNARLGFGKDKLRGIYKPVWLYNSSEYGLENVTTCEVFDFSTSTWRYIYPASPYRINNYHYPVYLDGSLYWLTVCEETKVLSFDLHTESFQVISKAPFSRERGETFRDIMCILENHRLCVLKRKGLTQVIWSIDSSGDDKTWKKLYSIDLTTLSRFRGYNFPLEPIVNLSKNKLLLQSHHYLGQLVIHDLHAKSFDLLHLESENGGYPVYYYQSLFSALSSN